MTELSSLEITLISGGKAQSQEPVLSVEPVLEFQGGASQLVEPVLESPKSRP